MRHVRSDIAALPLANDSHQKLRIVLKFDRSVSVRFSRSGSVGVDMTDLSDMGLTTLSIRTALLGWQCSDYLQHINFRISRRSARLTTGPTGFMLHRYCISFWGGSFHKMRHVQQIQVGQSQNHPSSQYTIQQLNTGLRTQLSFGACCLPAFESGSHSLKRYP